MITRSRSVDSGRPYVTVLISFKIKKKRIQKTQKKEAKTNPITNKLTSDDSNPSKRSRLTLRAARESHSPYCASTSVSTPDGCSTSSSTDFRQLVLHPDAASVEPYRVHCAKCGEWIPMTTKYHLSTFTVHVTSICKNRTANESKAFSTTSSSGSFCSTNGTIDTSDTSRDIKGSCSRWSRHRSEEERAQFLRDDPRTGRVEPRRVFCTICQKWIRLRDATTYCATPWLVHIARCTKKNS